MKNRVENANIEYRNILYDIVAGVHDTSTKLFSVYKR